MEITQKILIQWNACKEGMDRFCELFPDGATLKDAAHALILDGHSNWAIWLYNKCSRDDRFKQEVVGGIGNTGTGNNGYLNSGDNNSGNYNVGDSNSGNYNSGHLNSGEYNSGYYNSGNFNCGDNNDGSHNSGHYNSGNYNSGHFNSGSDNSGDFNTITPFYVFNKPCDRSEWRGALKPTFIFNINLNYWVNVGQMTKEEKAADPGCVVRGGQLRKISYKEAWRVAYESATDEDKALLKQLPNFDADVFFEISGIRV